MYIICYDFGNDKMRGKFSKFLKKFGRRIQYSVYEIKNSQRVLKNIHDEVELKYKKYFKGSDSIIIFRVCAGCIKNISRYGYAKNEERDLIFFE